MRPSPFNMWIGSGTEPRGECDAVLEKEEDVWRQNGAGAQHVLCTAQDVGVPQGSRWLAVGKQ